MGKPMILPGLLSCRDCSLCEGRIRVVPGWGSWPANLMIVAQSPGAQEDLQGIPLVGKSGQYLKEACQIVGINLDEQAFKTNVVLCHPPDNRKTKPTEAKACRRWLDAQIEAVDPEVMLLLGDDAIKALMPEEKKITVTKSHGLVFKREIAGRERHLIPMYHPAFVLRNRSVLNPQFLADLRVAKRVIDAGGYTAPNAPLVSKEITADELVEIVTNNDIFGFDLETEWLYSTMTPCSIVGIGVSQGPGQGGYWIAHDEVDVLEILWRIKDRLEDPNVTKVIQNASYERLVLEERYGIRVQGIEDTMIQAWILGDQKALDLKTLVHSRYGIEMIRIDKLIGSGKKTRSMADVQEEDPELVAKYSAADPDGTLRLHVTQSRLLKDRGQWDLYSQLEVPLIDIAVDMERFGVKFDSSALDFPRRELEHSMGVLKEQLFEMTGREFNPVSSQQVAKIVYDEWHLLTERHDGSKPTDVLTLAAVSHVPLVRAILSYRAQKRTLGFCVGLPKHVAADGRIHPSINQTGAETGRASVSRPNLQQIPSRTRDGIDTPVPGHKVRQAFVASPGNFLYTPDLSQVEMRFAAHLSNDATMIAMLTNGDIHDRSIMGAYQLTQEELDDIHHNDPSRYKNCRFVAKTVGFGSLYGLTGKGFVNHNPTLGFTAEEAQGFIDRFYDTYPGLREYQQRTIQFCRKHGYVQTISGRRRYLPNINSSNRSLKEAAERAAINVPIQGGAADYFKRCLILVNRRLRELKLKSRMILQIHDEIMLEGPFEELDIIAHEVPPIMATAIPLNVPVKVDMEYGLDWCNLLEYKETA